MSVHITVLCLLSQSFLDSLAVFLVSWFVEQGEHILLVCLYAGLVERIHAKGVSTYAAGELEEIEQTAKDLGIDMVDRNLYLRHAAIDVGKFGAQLCHGATMLYMLACKEVKLIKVLLVDLDYNAAVGFLYVDYGLEHNPVALLDELAH